MGLFELIDYTFGMYQDACGLEACATWDNDTDMQERADVAWSRYEGAKELLSLVFNISERQVDDDMVELISAR